MALAVGCTEAEGVSEFQPDTNKSGNVTLLASIENADSRASLVATGETRWQPNDAIKVVCDDSSTAIFNIDGTGETRRALFTGTVEGKSVGQYAIYPTTAELIGDNLSVELPSQVAASPTGTCAFMAGVIDEKNEVVFKQLTAYVTVQINKLDPSTGSIVFSSDKDLSGLHSVTLPEGMESGAAAKNGDATVSVVFTEAAPSMVNVFFALPVGDYAHITATAYNTNGKKLNEVVLGNLIAASRGLLLDYQIELAPAVAEKPAEIPGTVNVAGIYWAVGNLEYDKDCVATAGFNAGWRIAPNQAHFIRCEEKADGDITALTNFDRYDHFNFGGIAAPFSALATDAVDNVEPGFNFGGKMYTDQACKVETTDFAAAKYGDVAYWASNGQYRTPSDEDFKVLYEKANVQAASYTLGSSVIKGVYFTDPEWGETPTIILEEKVLSDADLKVGLFLPNAGRGYNKESTQFNIYKLGAQNWQRTTVVDVNSAPGACVGVLFAPHYLLSDVTKASYYYNAAYGSTGRYSIRPIYVGPGSGTVTPPTPGPEPEPDPTPGPDTDPVPTTGTVTVAGVEWAIGNLQFISGGTTGDGFNAGWSISAGQHYHLYLGTTGELDGIEDQSKMAHFNFGGIENPCTNDAYLCASIAGAKDISGKMYTDQTCVNETSDYTAAKFGDIAFWASKGQYRMPTAEEMQKLYTDACRTKATYTTADGVTVSGTYYYEPAAGEEPGAKEEVKELKNADMSKGLFLPYTGRYYSVNINKLYGINSQGVYRTATTISESTLEQTYAAIYRPHTLTEKEGKYPTEYIYTYWESKNQGAYGAISLYSIRPVKVK